MIMKRITILAIAAAISLNLAAQKNGKTVLNIQQTISDNAIVYPESFETDTQKLLEGWYLKNYTDIDLNNTNAKDPGASDEVVKTRLAEMQTVIEMPFNQIVRSYIDKYLIEGKTWRPFWDSPHTTCQFSSRLSRRLSCPSS